MALKWHLFSFPFGMLFYLFGESRWQSDIDGFMEVLRCFFSTGVCFIKCLSYPFDCIDSSNNIYLCTFVSGARGLQSPPLSGSLSFPTSLSRPRGPRRFCCKQSATAGPTVSTTARRHHSAKTCSMRCTNLQVNNTLHQILPLTGDDCIPLMRPVFLKRE